ncbi:MAG TPA: DNA gyrase subunit A [Candidatus Nanoarchaeia archaeon]|nr:DNA gyrase subunit A [Candidatus Nanoarchaeia archaeon]
MRYCVTGDTLLLTDSGIRHISQISSLDEQEIQLKILSLDGKKNTASKFFNSGFHPTIRLETNLGYAICGSYNHPILCWGNKDGFPCIEWKTLDTISDGDIVVLSRGNGHFSKSSLKLNPFFPKEGFKNQIDLPKKMNDDLAFLLGALVSEGSFHNKQILFNNKDITFYDKVKSLIFNQFEGIQIYERQVKGSCTELSIYEQKVVKFLKNIGLVEERSDKKEIPFSILQSSKENIIHFLQALFEGDGSVVYKTDKRHNGKSIELTYNSKSLTLINQLKVLLLNLGIVTTCPYKDKRNGCYKLIISGHDSIESFKQNAGFFSERKVDCLSHIDGMNNLRLSKTDFVPYLSDYLRAKYKKEFIHKHNLDRYNLIKKNYAALVNLIDPKDKHLIDLILKRHYFFDTVKKISKTGIKQQVYSIRVDSGCHSFVANGFINHNTEARLKKLSEDILQDIDKETVKFVANFDGSLKEPSVLPSKVPNLLINGSSGIAVGMATNIPPHNLSEVAAGIISVIEDPDTSVEQIMQHIKGPDFPTGATICGSQGIKHAYKTGRGRVIVRAKAEVEEDRILIHEIPYMVNKAELIKQIAALVNDDKLTGISDIRDESDREGMRIVIELKKDANPNVVLNQLYKHTRLQETFGIIMVALVNNEPKYLGIKEIIHYFIEHRKEIVRKRTEFDLNKAKEKAHILEGLLKALADIDNVIALIKHSKSAENAKKALQESLLITEKQAAAILEMRLQRLTALEQEKIKLEHAGLMKLIKELTEILASEKRILDIINQEMLDLKEEYGDDRRTMIEAAEAEALEMEDLIKEEKTVITITHTGYIKRQPLAAYKQQKRGGKGIIAAGTKEEDFVENMFIANTHSYLLFFTDKGRIHWLKVYNVPEGSRQALGKSIVNLLEIGQDEKISAFIPVAEFKENEYLIMATRKGTVKKTELMAYSNPRKGGIIAITLDPGDELIEVVKTNGNNEIMLATKNGSAVRFKETDVRPTGRSSKGVIGATLRDNDEIVGMVVADDNNTVLTITNNGYGKRTPVSEYRLTRRGGVGVKNILCSERNGCVVAVKTVKDNDELMFISRQGITIRTPANGISIIGRATQGMRLMKLDDNDSVVAAAKIIGEDVEVASEQASCTNDEDKDPVQGQAELEPQQNPDLDKGLNNEE